MSEEPRSERPDFHEDKRAFWPHLVGGPGHGKRVEEPRDGNYRYAPSPHIVETEHYVEQRIGFQHPRTVVVFYRYVALGARPAEGLFFRELLETSTEIS